MTQPTWDPNSGTSKLEMKEVSSSVSYAYHYWIQVWLGEEKYLYSIFHFVNGIMVCKPMRFYSVRLMQIDNVGERIELHVCFCWTNDS